MKWRTSILLILTTLTLIHLQPALPQIEGERVIVEFTDWGLQALSRVGRIGGVLGNIAVVEPRTELRGMEFVEEVWRPRRLKLSLDVSVPEIGAPETWRYWDEAGNPLDGRGVAIAIIDTGVDYRHPDFWFDDGKPKILAIWDQTVEGKPPEGFGYGYECTVEEIVSGSCPEVDEVGHGTHVASIVAGAGRAGPYRGVAPGAYLIVVKSGYPACGGAQWFMEEDEILDALTYVSRKARELGLRLVVNLSLGTDLGGHDGSSPLEKAVEALAEKGVIVVAAAGNSADDGIHASGTLREGEEVELRWRIAAMTHEFELTLWLNTGDEVNVSLTHPWGENPAPFKDLMLEYLHVNLTLQAHETGNEWLLEIRSNESIPTDGWGLRIMAEKILIGEWHAWISSDTCSFTREHFLPGKGYEVSGEYTVSIPATSRAAIAVGAYVTKNRWRSYYGGVSGTGYKVGELLRFSGRGPTRDGRVKPDLVAPGSVIVAARPLSQPNSTLDVNEYYAVKQGTSMAAPHVAGVVALILQFKPDASFREILEALKAAARWSPEMGERPNNLWGWGKLSARVVYQVLVNVTGLPSGFRARLTLDGEEVKAFSGQLLNLTLLKGRSHVIRPEHPIIVESGVRYSPKPRAVEVSGEGVVEIHYFLEYRLEVRSVLGGELGGGWYRAGEVAKFSAKPYFSPIGLEILLKPSLRLVGWVDERGRFHREGRLVMDGPHVVSAVYAEDYSLMLLGWLIILSACASTLYLLRRWRRA